MAIFRIAALFALTFLPGFSSEIKWREFDAATLAKAREEKKLVFLDVEAVWCHWCHVMDRKTFAESEVQQALDEGFISAKLDQDSRPDLSRRYEEYGWPALVVIDPVTMGERAIGSGFQTKEEFLTLLKRGQARSGDLALFASTGAAPAGGLKKEQRDALLKKLVERYDTAKSGWGSGSKFVPWGNIELCIRLSGQGDAAARKMAEATLTAASALIDPVWGGLYQYSTDGDWAHPHFEKIMQFEAEISRAYALAYLAWGRPEDLKAAEQIVRHLRDFLRSPEGAYYVSQDADVVQGEHSADYFAKNDGERRASGVPRVDRHIYSRENGLAINALAALYQATGNIEYLRDAETAARWIIAHRSLPGGGFSHDAHDTHGPFLADQVEMGRAFNALHQATGEGKWLALSVACADFCQKEFVRGEGQGAGYFSGRASPDAPPPVVDRDENIELTRWLNLLARTSKEARFTAAAEHAMRFLSSEPVSDGIFSFVGGLVLANDELAEEPIHIAIVGRKDDPAAAALDAAARRHPASYKVVEWLAPGAESGDFPQNERAAAYLCTSRQCSPPKFTARELGASFRADRR